MFIISNYVSKIIIFIAYRTYVFSNAKLIPSKKYRFRLASMETENKNIIKLL